MIKSIIPKLPMRNASATKAFYVDGLEFKILNEYPGYLQLEYETFEIHFFLYSELDPLLNYGQIYLRVEGIEDLYAGLNKKNISIHENGALQLKPWGQKEFSLLDPDNNLLTFGEAQA